MVASKKSSNELGYLHIIEVGKVNVWDTPDGRAHVAHHFFNRHRADCLKHCHASEIA